MKSHIIYRPFIISLLFFFTCTSAFSQEALEESLVGKTRIDEIMPVVDTYFKTHHEENEEEFESEYLHWKRWEWYMSGRLGPDGEFVKISELLLEGLKEKEKMPGSHDRNINSSWSFVGPTTTPLLNPTAIYNGIGRVDRIAFHPTNSSIIYIGTPAGGLWRTIDGGFNWDNLTDNLPSIGISGIVVSHADPNDLYILTGDGDSNISGFVEDFGYMRPSIGVLKSTDGGDTWHQTGIFPYAENLWTGYKLIQSPSNANILFAATSTGLYRTINGGDSWTEEFAPKAYDIEFKPGDATRVYASTKGGFWLSTDSGANWSPYTATFDIHPNTCYSGGRVQIAVAPTSSAKVYLIAGPVLDTGIFCGVWLSTDSGASFTRQSNIPNILGSSDNGMDAGDQSGYDLAITCRPDLSTQIVIAGLTVWRSTASGASWIHSSSYSENGASPYIHPDVHDLAYNPLNNWLYAATDGGFFRSQDYGVTWVNFSSTIETSQFYNMAGWSGNQYKLLGGLQDNGIKYRKTNSSVLYHISGGDGFDVHFNPLTGEPLYSSINGGIAKYSGDGTSQTWITPDTLDHYFKTIAVHNTNPNILLVGDNDIFKTTSGGAPYLNKGASGSWGIISCPSNSSRFYSIGGDSYGNGVGQLYISNDIGDTWTAKSGNDSFPTFFTKITDVAVRPNTSSNVWACFGGFNAGTKVVRSANSGDTWSNVSANLPNVPINCLAIDSDNGAYAGTDIGVFYRGPSMNQWMPWSNGIPNVPVTELVIFDDGTNKWLRAATFGRGVWQSVLASTCDPAVVVTGVLKGIRHYEASTSISSTSDVLGGVGTFVSFKSGSYILLSDGFSVINESKFLGFLSPCGQGGIPGVTGDDTEDRSNPNASIIPLRRMWDEKDGLPYGSIDLIETKNNHATIHYSVKNAGKVKIVAARQIQDQLAVMYSGEVSSGQHIIEADIENLPREFHYLLLFYEGKLAHFQELDLRP